MGGAGQGLDMNIEDRVLIGESGSRPRYDHRIISILGGGGLRPRYYTEDVHIGGIMAPLLTDSRLDMMLSRTSGHWGREGEVEGGHKHRVAPSPGV